MNRNKQIQNGIIYKVNTGNYNFTSAENKYMETHEAFTRQIGLKIADIETAKIDRKYRKRQSTVGKNTKSCCSIPLPLLIVLGILLLIAFCF